jgi:predicted MPP superfamily phosphohydrolase
VLDGLRVAVLADLHVGSPWNGVDNLERVIERTNAAGADLILLAGDYVITTVIGGTFVPPETTADALRALHAPLGVYAVLGNHDCWLDAPRMRTAFERAGIPVLSDAAREVDPSRGLWLAGIGDFWVERHDVRAALADVPHDAVVLAFTHNPDVFPQVPHRVALTIAGHTHGGQVALPFVGRPIVPSAYGERYAIGHVVERDRHLFVSPGIGTSVVPVRFRVPPEISLLTLQSADDARAAR